MEAKLAEKGRKYKEGSENISIILQHNLRWSGKQRKALARGTTGTGCQASPGQRFMYPRNLPPAVARGGHLWAERKDMAGTQ